MAKKAHEDIAYEVIEETAKTVFRNMVNKGIKEMAEAEKTAQRDHSVASPAVRDRLFAAEAYFDAAHASTSMITDKSARAEARQYLRPWKAEVTRAMRGSRRVRR
jgi:hypothetical protein